MPNGYAFQFDLFDYSSITIASTFVYFLFFPHKRKPNKICLFWRRGEGLTQSPFIWPSAFLLTLLNFNHWTILGGHLTESIITFIQMKNLFLRQSEIITTSESKSTVFKSPVEDAFKQTCQYNSHLRKQSLSFTYSYLIEVYESDT